MKIKGVHEKEVLKHKQVFLVKCLLWKKMMDARRSLATAFVGRVKRVAIKCFWRKILLIKGRCMGIQKKNAVYSIRSLLKNHIKRWVDKLQRWRRSTKQRPVQTFNIDSLAQFVERMKLKFLKAGFKRIQAASKVIKDNEQKKTSLIAKVSKIGIKRLKKNYLFLIRFTRKKAGLKAFCRHFKPLVYRTARSAIKHILKYADKKKYKEKAASAIFNVSSKVFQKAKFAAFRSKIQLLRSQAKGCGKLLSVIKKVVVKHSLAKLKAYVRRMQRNICNSNMLKHLQRVSQASLKRRLLRAFKEYTKTKRLENALVRRSACIYLMQFIRRKLSRPFYLLVNSIIQRLKEDNLFTQALLEEHKLALEVAYESIESQVSKKLEEFNQNEPMNQLKIALIVRAVLNYVGYSAIHDAEILKIINEFSDSGIDYECIAKSIMNSIRAGKTFKSVYSKPQGKRVQYAIDFINSEFNTYDYKNEGELNPAAVILLFQRHCVFPSNAEDSLEAYDAFCLASAKITVWSKEETIRFIVEHIRGPIKKIPILRVRSVSTATLTENREPVLHPISENEEDKSISKLKSRLASIESKIDTLSKSQLEPEKPVEAFDVMKSIVSSKITQRTHRKLPFSHLVHRCNSEYCLLCKHLYK